MIPSFPATSSCSYCGSLGYKLVRTQQNYTAHFCCHSCHDKIKPSIKDKCGYIYMVGFDQWWKIGFTTVHLEKRLKALQTACPFELKLSFSKIVNDVITAELFIHNRLQQFHHRAEWFKGNEDEIKSAAGFVLENN